MLRFIGLLTVAGILGLVAVVCLGVFARDGASAPSIAAPERPAAVATLKREPKPAAPMAEKAPPRPEPKRTPDQLLADRRAAGYVERAKKALAAGNALGAAQFLKLGLGIDGVDHADALALQQTMKNADDPAWALERLAKLSDAELQALDSGDGAPPALFNLGYDVLTRRAVANARSQLGPLLAERAELRRREAEAAETARLKAEAEAKEREKEERRQRATEAKRRKEEQAAIAAQEAEARRIAEEEYDADGLVLLLKTVHAVSGEITGEVVNRRGRKLIYAQITFALYDESGARVGTALDNISDLEAGGRWKFKAVAFDRGTKYKFSELTGF